jgi:cyanophycin synthetase
VAHTLGAPMRVLDSRRLTGRSLLLDRPGVVLDIVIDDALREPAHSAWERAVRQLLLLVGWDGENVVTRRFSGGMSLGFSAPIDGLYAATELNEQAWEAAAAEIEGREPPDLSAAAARLSDLIAGERNPRLLPLREAARIRRLTFLSDEEHASIGSGTGAIVWPIDSLPDPSTIPWTQVHDVPVALVTGSNGKTTVVRLISAVIRAAGRVPGSTSTDGIQIGSERMEEGDFSGPSGARFVLRHPQVEIAVLETARGGILRRGISVERAKVAVVTNIAEDHLGEFGVGSLQDLAEAKLLVAKAVAENGYLVLNADDSVLVERSHSLKVPIIWFSLDGSSGLIRSHTKAGGVAVVVEDGDIVLVAPEGRTKVIHVGDVPITFGGTATHNVANVMTAVAAAWSLEIKLDAIKSALRSFGHNAGDNPGRANLFEVGGAHVLIDYAHNAHGMSALVGMAQRIPANRRLVMLGQAGDRDDGAIRDFARAAWELRPDRVVVKDTDQYLRGRHMGEIPGLLADELTRLGTPSSSIYRAPDEVDGVRDALTWARPGDLLVLAVHQDRRQVLGLFDRLGSSGWKVGEPLPD